MAAAPLAGLARSIRGEIRRDLPALRIAARDGSHLIGRPSAVVAPADPSDVVALVRWARRHWVALVPRGAGTSLDGESVPARGAIVVDFSGWDRIREVAPEGRLGPGRTRRRERPPPGNPAPRRPLLSPQPRVVADLHDRGQCGHQCLRSPLVPLRSDPSMDPGGGGGPRYGGIGPPGEPGREAVGRPRPAAALHRERGDARARDRDHGPSGTGAARASGARRATPRSDPARPPRPRVDPRPGHRPFGRRIPRPLLGPGIGRGPGRAVGGGVGPPPAGSGGGRGRRGRPTDRTDPKGAASPRGGPRGPGVSRRRPALGPAGREQPGHG